MKKALVMTFVLVLGLGFAAFADAGLGGKWTASISFAPDEPLLADFITFSSDLEIDYTIGGWTFKSITGFTADGYDSQSFTAGGIVGAFTFSSTMNFLPAATLTKTTTTSYGGSTYNLAIPWISWPFRGLPANLATVVETELEVITSGVAFDDWTVEGSVSIAGVSFEALFFMENWVGTLETTETPTYWYELRTQTPALILGPALVYSLNPVPPATGWNYYMPQSGSYTVVEDQVTWGAGWRFKVAGSFGDVTLTSYTYFNLIEGFDMDADPDTKSFARDGDFTISIGDQEVRFTEEYITLEGMSLGCLTWDAALRITCDHGFEYFSLWFKDIYLMCCGISTDFEIDFYLADKTVELFPTITTDWTCIEPTIEFDLSDDKSIINGINLTALSAEIALNGVTFSSNTYFDSSLYDQVDNGTTEDTYILVPAIPSPTTIPSVDTTGGGYYEVHKISFTDDYITTWEDFTITVDGDACCGGAFEISLTTAFGWRYTETLAEFGYWYETNTPWGGVGAGTIDHGQGLYWDVAGTYGAAGGWYTYSDTPGADGASQLLFWPGCGNIPTLNVDVAYSNLIGLSGTAPVVYVAGTAAQLRALNHGTTVTAAANGLFSWAKSEVDTKIGVGSNFTLTFGLAIDYYGWDSVSFGFEFEF